MATEPGLEERPGVTLWCPTHRVQLTERMANGRRVRQFALPAEAAPAGCALLLAPGLFTAAGRWRSPHGAVCEIREVPDGTA